MVMRTRVTCKQHVVHMDDERQNNANPLYVGKVDTSLCILVREKFLGPQLCFQMILPVAASL